MLDGRLYDDRPEHVAEFTHIFSLPADGGETSNTRTAGVAISDLGRIPYDD